MRLALRRSQSAADTARLEAFSDGVLAIAITLLILDVRIDAKGSVGAELRHAWPHYVAYVTSFVTIAVMWANHHDLFKLIARSDRGLMFFNALLLMGIAFLPFPTGVLAEHLQDSSEDRQSALLAYGFTMVLIAIFYQLLWRYSCARDLVRSDLTEDMKAHITRGYNPAFVLYVAALPLSFFSAWFSIAVWLGLAVFFLFFAYETGLDPVDADQDSR
jgi:uncharacterized membrane protein